MNLNVDIDFIVHAAETASKIALGMTATASHELKADQTYVTNVDRAIEQLLIQQLSAKYPDFAFQGEEYGIQGNFDNPIFSIDPIDGTTNMVLGLPLWGVSIGLVYENKAQLGVISLPRVGETYSAVLGKGAFCNGQQIKARDTLHPHSEDPLCYTTRCAKQMDITKWPGVLRSLGSMAAELAYVSSGALSAIVGHSRTLHDIAAGFCIAQEAGCEIGYIDGSEIDIMEIYNQGTQVPFIVAPPKLKEWILKNIITTSPIK